MSVIDDGLSFISIPTVQLHAAAAVIQGSMKKIHIRSLIIKVYFESLQLICSFYLFLL